MSAPTTATRGAPPSARRVGVRIRGTVQGVGFRPYVFRLAEQLGLGGWVLNDEQGVLCEVEGAGDAVERFLARLPAEAPPLASIESVRSLATTPVGEREFRILASEGRSEPEALVCADA